MNKWIHEWIKFDEMSYVDLYPPPIMYAFLNLTGELQP